MLLKELKGILKEELSITLSSDNPENHYSDDYTDFEHIEEERLESEVISIDTWNNPRHANERSYLITLK